MADRHYSRKTIGSPQFVAPGRCLVFLGERNDALWVSHWGYPQYVQHQFKEAWLCSLFRNESNQLSSELILQAIAATVYVWGEPPRLGMVTFVNSNRIRRKRDPGRCFRKAGFSECGRTKGNLIVLCLSPHQIPIPQPAINQQLFLPV